MSLIQLETDFSCAHFYRQDKWDEKKNLSTFGKCFSQYGHGHDYLLQVQFEVTEQHPIPLALVEAMRELKEELDHKHLNFLIPEFKDKVPTTENVALYCQEKLTKKLPQFPVKKLRLYEKPDLWVEIQF